eukprot:6019237-Pleurochrysis_carterae.AAC.1
MASTLAAIASAAAPRARAPRSSAGAVAGSDALHLFSHPPSPSSSGARSGALDGPCAACGASADSRAGSP